MNRSDWTLLAIVAFVINIPISFILLFTGHGDAAVFLSGAGTFIIFYSLWRCI